MIYNLLLLFITAFLVFHVLVPEGLVVFFVLVPEGLVVYFHL